MTWFADLEAAAMARSQAGLHRDVRHRGEDDGLIDLAGNDYLGFARHPEVAAAAATALKAYGLGATASRLVRGSTTVHAELEQTLAGWLGCEAALVYSSGYLANLGAVRAFAPGLIASDAYNHASLVDGCRLASRDGSPVRVYDHASPASLSASLAGSTPLAVTESVFSVHGDLAPLAALHDVVRGHEGVLLVDDAHGLGVIGPGGAGGADRKSVV